MRDIYSYINELEVEINQYRVLGTVEEIRSKMEELTRWHSDRLNSRIKNEFAAMSTLICHNCDHKDEYIEELEAEIEEYRAIGTVEECRVAVEMKRRIAEIVNQQLIAGKDNYKEVYNCFYDIVKVMQARI